MRYPRALRFAGIAALFGGALLITACQARVAPSPANEPEATSLFVRNFTGYDVSIFAVPRVHAKPVWLTNVGVGSSRSIAIRWRDLQANGGLVIRTQIVGRNNTWTSEPLIIDDGIVGVLDLKTDKSLTTVGSALRGVTVQAFGAAMR
jgi:hypothetical protein